MCTDVFTVVCADVCAVFLPSPAEYLLRCVLIMRCVLTLFFLCSSGKKEKLVC